MTRRGVVPRLLALILAVWEPLNLALFVAPAVATLGTRGAAPAAFLLLRIVIAALGVAAGISLWRGQPHARALAILALILSTIASALTLATTLLPTNIMPGDEWVWLALIAGHNGGWVVYLYRFYR